MRDTGETGRRAGAHDDTKWLSSGAGRAAALICVVLMVALRVVALRSDAYARLSWSSALLTDEGFYLHNARNLVLFGHARTDAFNNRLIMPLLHALQVLLFRSVGVGTLPARALSVACSLLLLGLWADALRRAYGRRVAAVGTLLLGLDHVMLLYNRLALMDTPATLLVGGAYWAWVRGGASEGGRSGGWYGVCGALLGAGYGVRGLVAVVWVGALGSAWWVGRGSGRGAWVGVVGGLGLWVGGYALLWWLPHHAEIARVNRYYIQRQIVPHSLAGLYHNILHNLFGEERGFSPYLFRHTPIQFGLVLLTLAAWGAGRRWTVTAGRAAESTLFLALWLLSLLAAYACISYSPSRYYVLFYPPMAALCALALADLPEAAQRVWGNRAVRGALGAFLAFQLAEAIAHHADPAVDLAIAIAACAFGATLAAYRGSPRSGGLFQTRIAALMLLAWAFVNACWLGDWLTHLRYTQQDADLWLQRHLPADCVLIGDAAPGLCMNSRFIAVPVIPGLCNDVRPLERYAGRPRAIVILDGRRNEGWWHDRYPGIVAPERRLHHFLHVIKFDVSVYTVGELATTRHAQR